MPTSSSEQFNDLQKLAIVHAFGDAVKKVEKQLRDGADDGMRDAFLEDAVTQKQLMLNGQKVGTISVRMSKPVNGSRPQIDKAEEFVQWLRNSDGGLDTLRRMVTTSPDWCLDKAIEDGELPDGCVMVERNEPAMYKGTTLHVQLPKVIDALGPQLGATAAALLTGEVE